MTFIAITTARWPQDASGAANRGPHPDRKSTRLNSSHVSTSYAVFCLKKKMTLIRESARMAQTSTRQRSTLTRSSLLKPLILNTMLDGSLIVHPHVQIELSPQLVTNLT